MRTNLETIDEVYIDKSTKSSKYLIVNSLSYHPARDYINEINSTIYNAIPKPFDISNNPNKKQTRISNSEKLNNVSFTSTAGEITGVIGNNQGEVRTLLGLIARRKKRGLFVGDITLNGVAPGSNYSSNYAFIPHKTLYIPSLTFYETLNYAARLHLSDNKHSININDRIEEVINIMGLSLMKNRVISEFPSERGEVGRDMRLLSIAIEIMRLPVLIVIDDPVLNLDPGFASKIFKCLSNLASRGHIVLCGMPKPHPLVFPSINHLVLLSNGYSIYSSSINNVQSFFCSPEMGYEFSLENELIDFIIDVSSGVERPSNSRQAEPANVLQEKFELSPYNQTDKILITENATSVSAFSNDLFFLYGYARVDPPLVLLTRSLVIIERAIISKLKDTETIKRSLGGSLLISTIIGYLQFDQGMYGYYTMTLFGFPYYNTANVTAVLFFVSAFTFVQQILNVHVLNQKLQVYRYEQSSRCCTPEAFFIALIISDIPFTVFYAWIFSSIIYFMTDMNKGYYNYFYFNGVLALMAVSGLATTVLLSIVLQKEIPVRDTYLMFTVLMVILSGFPFQLPEITSYFSDISQINPMRWVFEALMSWKFLDYYADGYYYIKAFGFEAYNCNNIFLVLLHFLLFGWILSFVLLQPFPMLLRRVDSKDSNRTTRQRPHSESNTSVGESFDQVNVPMRKKSNSITKPLIFARESSITSKSQLSVSTTPFADDSSKGPTVLFHSLTYKVKDRRSPLGYKAVLNNVSGQFDWGKLSVIIGAPQSGKSSLLHILAGDIGIRTDLTGDIYLNSKVVDRSIPLWQRCALVEAHDEQYRDLTVKDIVHYAMLLRCVKRDDYKVVENNVKVTLEILHLEEVAHKKTKHISPGERRRLSLAEEIVHGPSLVLIDEPTTGLSIHDESVMMMTCREMVNQDKTVIVSMPQLSVSSFKLFDTILLLSKGRVIYHGSAKHAPQFFITSPYSYDFSNYTVNPGDFLSDISAGLLRAKDGDIIESSLLENYYQSTDLYNNLMSRYNKVLSKQDDKTVVNPVNSSFGEKERQSNSFDLESSNPKLDALGINTTKQSKKYHRNMLSYVPIPTILQIVYVVAKDFVTWKPNDLMNLVIKSKIILDRSTKGLISRWELVYGSVLVYILLACVFGWILGDISAQAYNATSFFAVTTLFLIIVDVMFVFYIFKTNQVGMKELSRGLYTNFTSWLVASVPLYILTAINAVIYSVIVYKITNLNTQQSIYSYFLLYNVVALVTGMTMAEAVIYSVSDVRSSYLAIPALVIVQFGLSGLFIKSASLPGWLSWAPATSIIRWVLEGNFINQFENNTTVFATIGTYSTYYAFLELFGWTGISKWGCFYVIFYFLLTFKMVALISNGLAAAYEKGGRSFKRYIEDW